MNAMILLAGSALITVVFAVIVSSSVARRHRDISPERRCRQAILDLSVDRDRRLWAAGSTGVVGAGSQFGCGAGCECVE